MSSGVANCRRTAASVLMAWSVTQSISPNAAASGEQQALEFVLLDIGKHPRRIGDALPDLLHQTVFQRLDRKLSLVAKTVEVDQRRHGVERSVQVNHLRYESSDADVATANTAGPGAGEQERGRLDFPLPQMAGEHLLDERLFGLAFHGYGETDHGRPPSRFFCQSSPVV